jgi:hypothetical protein
VVQCRGMADSSDDCHQARHLMTASQSRKSARRTRRLSTGHRRARSDIQLASQIVRQFIMPDAIRRPFTAASPSANLLGRLDPNNKPHPRLSNLHNARGTAFRSLTRGFLPWRLSDAGRRTRGAVPHAAGIGKPFTNADINCRDCDVRSLAGPEPDRQVFAKFKHLSRKAVARSSETICVTIGEILRAFTPTQCATGCAQS